ncbi:MAG: serine hydrolase domain-containing protein [Acidimicrobiales bacterium]
MSELAELAGELQSRLDRKAGEGRVPGAALAVSDGTGMVEAATGVLNLGTGVETTTDSVFQVGSITKVWTSTLVMQLVDEGKVDLDSPLRSYLPGFRIADESAGASLTVRQVLSHVAGFEGDVFTDTGRGDDAIEKYLGVLSGVPQLFRPGEMFSYNNAGFCVLGRLVEVLRGQPYGAVLRQRLAGPLGLSHLATRAEEAILHRAALGHVRPTPEADPSPAPVWSLAPSNEAAGSMLSMSPRDLLGFAAMHLRGGTAPDGARILSDKAVRAMQERQVELPFLGMMGNAWGLGWEIFDWEGGPVIGHDGGTIGQSAFLRIVPEANVSVALLTNGGNPFPMYQDVFGLALSELAGVSVPAHPEPPSVPPPVSDPSRYVGRYEADVVVIDVSVDDAGQLRSTMTVRGPLAEAGGADPEEHDLVLLSGETFLTADATEGIHQPLAFLGDDGQGRAQFVHMGRAVRRAG